MYCDLVKVKGKKFLIKFLIYYNVNDGNDKEFVEDIECNLLVENYYVKI